MGKSDIDVKYDEVEKKFDRQVSGCSYNNIMIFAKGEKWERYYNYICDKYIGRCVYKVTRECDLETLNLMLKIKGIVLSIDVLDGSKDVDMVGDRKYKITFITVV